MNAYTFTFKSAYNGKAEYEMHHGRAYCGRVVAMPEHLTLAMYGADRPVPREAVQAFNAMQHAQKAIAREKYPEYADEPFMQPRVWRAA